MNDENVKVIACGCGQKNHLILQDGNWVFDEKKHGRYVYPPNEEKAKGCFNCHKPFPWEVAEKTPEEVVVSEPATKVKKKK